jgi:hypothetical protein
MHVSFRHDSLVKLVTVSSSSSNMFVSLVRKMKDEYEIVLARGQAKLGYMISLLASGSQ